MVKVFLSQPMKDKGYEEIGREREKAAKFLHDLYGIADILILDNFFTKPHKNLPLWKLGESIKLLGSADIALFVPGYEEARGCIVEHLCAERYGVSWVDISDDFKAVKEASGDLCTVRRGYKPLLFYYLLRLGIFI